MTPSKLLNTANLLGKTENEARQICENFGYIMRLTSKDGEALIVTCELRSNRVNVGVINGHVSSINGIG